MEKEKYQELFDEFITKYNQSETSPSQAGEVLVRIAALYPNYNAVMIRAERAYALVCRDQVLQTDETTGKAISSVKSETLANATIEATAFKQARGHVANIEMLIGSLKFLQKSLEVEYANSSI